MAILIHDNTNIPKEVSKYLTTQKVVQATHTRFTRKFWKTFTDSKRIVDDILLDGKITENFREIYKRIYQAFSK